MIKKSPRDNPESSDSGNFIFQISISPKLLSIDDFMILKRKKQKL